MAYVTPHTWTSEQATVALMNEINNNLKALFPVGTYVYLLRSATTAETLIEGVWLECNAISVLRADFPDLNTLLSGLSYPFGTADGTHMTLPDSQGRSLVSMSSGGHVDVNALGDSDGVTKASRTPKAAAHTHTGPSHTHTVAAHTHTIAAFNAFAGGGNSANFAAETGSGGGGNTGSDGTGNTGSGGATSGAYLVGGTLFIKAVA